MSMMNDEESKMTFVCSFCCFNVIRRKEAGVKSTFLCVDNWKLGWMMGKRGKRD